MPLINGQKVACLPCIRGHRSTKCTHVNERVMVPVRKPGRPLSTCPHPPMRSCACSVVTAAIPKRQTCHCSTVAAAAAGRLEYAFVSMPASAGSDLNPPGVPSKGETENSSTTSSPPVTARPSTSYRIQKAAGKTFARKSSMGHAKLERADSSQVNMLPGPFSGLSQPRSMAQPPIDTTAASIGFGTPPPILRPATGHAYPETPMYRDFSSQYAVLDPPPHTPTQTSAPAPRPAPIQTAVSANGHAPLPRYSICGNDSPTSASPSAPSAPSTPNGINGRSSCCSGQDKTSTDGISRQRTASAPAQTHQQQPSLAPSPPMARKDTAGSCCSSKSKDRDMPPDQTALPPIGLSPFQQSVSALQDMYDVYYPPPTVFTYPASYGSYLQPLQPEQWRQMMENMSDPPAHAPVAAQHHRQESFSQAPQSATFGGLGSIAPPRAGIMHECNCGTGCQCLGCAAHPFNDATKEYVRSAWTSMLEDRDRRGSVESVVGLDGRQGSSGIPTPAQQGLHRPSTPAIAPATTMDEGSPPAPQTPASDTTSGAGEEQNHLADNFFFVSYPFDSCGGEEELCPCGDECQCFGCTIHGNNGRPVAMPNEPPSLELMPYNITDVIDGLDPELSSRAPVSPTRPGGGEAGGGGGVVVKP